METATVDNQPTRFQCYFLRCEHKFRATKISHRIIEIKEIKEQEEGCRAVSIDLENKYSPILAFCVNYQSLFQETSDIIAGTIPLWSAKCLHCMMISIFFPISSTLSTIFWQGYEEFRLRTREIKPDEIMLGLKVLFMDIIITLIDRIEPSIISACFNKSGRYFMYLPVEDYYIYFLIEHTFHIFFYILWRIKISSCNIDKCIHLFILGRDYYVLYRQFELTSSSSSC